MSKATIDWTQGKTGILRVHKHTQSIPGPWSWSCVIEMTADDTAMLHAAERAPTRDELKEIVSMLRAAGIRRVMWDRYKTSGNKRLVFSHV